MYKVYLVGQIPPVSARICGDEVDPLLLQGVQRLGDMVRQVCGILSEVPLKVRPRVGLVAHGDLVVAGVNWRQVGDGIPASESPPRCAWSFGGCAVVAAVQRYLLEVRSLQKHLFKCSHASVVLIPNIYKTLYCLLANTSIYGKPPPLRNNIVPYVIQTWKL